MSGRRWVTSTARRSRSARPGTTASSTSSRSTCIRGRSSTGRASWTEKGYTIPTTFDELKTLATKIQSDGLIPFAFADKEGWPAQGTFDIINLRQNGYDFHVNLMAGKEKWTDSRVTDVFDKWKEILPFHQEGAAGRNWADASTTLLQKKAAMYFHGMFTSQQFQTAGQADLDDLDFFPYPDFGTQFDAEKALDAPIDGFMLSKAPKNLDAAKAFLEYLAQPATQVTWVTADKSNIAASKDADVSGYSPLQKKAAEVIGAAQRITQFLDRDTNPEFAGPERHAGLPARLHPEPGPGSRPVSRRRSSTSGTRSSHLTARPVHSFEPWRIAHRKALPPLCPTSRPGGRGSPCPSRGGAGATAC